MAEAFWPRYYMFVYYTSVYDLILYCRAYNMTWNFLYTEIEKYPAGFTNLITLENHHRLLLLHRDNTTSPGIE